MWKICKTYGPSWNEFITTIGVIAQCGTMTECSNGIFVEISEELAMSACKNEKTKYRMDAKEVRELLEKYDLLTVKEKDGNITIKFKNMQVKRCLTQAGQALEMKTLLLARNMKTAEDKPCFTDAMNGVEIDWDGKWNRFDKKEDEYANDQITNCRKITRRHRRTRCTCRTRGGRACLHA